MNKLPKHLRHTSRKGYFLDWREAGKRRQITLGKVALPEAVKMAATISKKLVANKLCTAFLNHPARLSYDDMKHETLADPETAILYLAAASTNPFNVKHFCSALEDVNRAMRKKYNHRGKYGS